MRLESAAIAALLPLLVACRIERGAEPHGTTANTATQTSEPSPETFALGTALSTAGAVDQKASGENFRRGGQIYLSVDVSGASTNQQTVKVQWVDQRGRTLRQEARTVASPARYTAFSSGETGSWQPGHYKAVVVIDGRRVTEKAFSVM